MKRKITYHLLLLFFSVLFSVLNISAQETTTDTSEAEERTSVDYESEEDEPFYPDTLKRNFRSIVYDSVQVISVDKGFYYRRYMDSLLRATQAKVQRPRRPVNLDGFDFFNSVLGIMFWIVAIALFGFLVYKLFLSNSSFFSRNRKNTLPGVTVEAEENAEDPGAALRNAVRNGNYRFAIRYLYLQTLTRLSEKKMIELNTNKTNYEYVNEVRKHKFANDFASLTLQYEYVWYGEYPVDERLFEQIQSGFTQFNKNLTR